MLEQRIAQHFYESADLQSQSAAALSKPIALAAQLLLGCVTSGGKVMFYGDESCAPLAALGASLLTGRLERERLPLAGLSLNALGDASQSAQAIEALGTPGDVLVLLCSAERSPSLSPVLRAASNKELAVIALTGPTHPAVEANLTDTDVHIAVAHERRARLFETHALVLHALVDTLDVQLLGELESP